MTYWNAQLGDGKYAIQFETSDYELYKLVEKAAQQAIDQANEKLRETEQQPKGTE